MDLDEHTHDDLTLEQDHFLRATIAAARITLTPPLRGTITGGPASMTLARLDGVVLVDLRHSGEDDEELVATVPPNAPPITTAARRTVPPQPPPHPRAPPPHARRLGRRRRLPPPLAARPRARAGAARRARHR